MMRQRLILVLFIVLIPVTAEAQWGYLTPPWNFDRHPKYAGKEIQNIPISEWEQLAVFDTAASCEKGRLFAREIRNLSPNDRQHLVSLFASGAEDRARQGAQPLLSADLLLKKELMTKDDRSLVEEAELKMLKWWSASKCAPLNSVHP